LVKHGIDYRRATLSTEICQKLVKREIALELLSTPPFDPVEVAAETKYIAKKLAISVEDLNQIIAAPQKWYFNYPNSAQLLGRCYDLYRFFAGKEKTTSF
jgi:hypothetical protein